MEKAVRAKFEQNYNLTLRLSQTKNEMIKEGNYWGVDLKTGKGENNLGKIIMKIRNEIK